ncbi:MAG: 5'-nucleotidase SurE [Syntrophomonadaceae bacterium]|nr:5'-nucleotidase SurE [Bacillota bacterium]
MKKIILVTNDDGIESEGLTALAEALQNTGEVFIIAPDRERSATSHSFSAFSPISVKYINSHTMAIIDGTPTDCVMLALKRLLPRMPHLVVSGINKGANLGEDVNYSGTVAAAKEAAISKIPAFAISLATRNNHNFAFAAQFARKIASKICLQGLPPGTLLNVNVPNNGMPTGVKIARLGKRIYHDTIEEKVDKTTGIVQYRIAGSEPDWEQEEGTDFQAIEENMVSITPLYLDMTHHSFVSELCKQGYDEL